MSSEVPTTASCGSGVEFQAVVLAGGPGSRLEPMSKNQTKSLLPVANRPMLHYPLKLLECAGFQDVIVAAGPGNREAITHFIDEFSKTSKMRVNIVGVKQADDTADVLRELKDKLTSGSFVLVSGDVITEASLQELMDVHRIKDATVTMLLSEQSVDTLERKKMRKAADGVVDYFGVAASGKRDHSPRVVMMQSGGSEEPLVVSKALLKREPRFTVKTNLADAHVYIMKRWVLDLLDENEMTIGSVRHDLLPYLISLQYRGPEALSEEIRSQATNALQLAHDLSFNQPSMSLREDMVRCFSLVVPSKTVFTHRANNVASYLYTNKHIATSSIGPHTPWELPKSHAPTNNKRFRGSVVGIGCEFDVKCGANMSVLGEHCTLGAKAEVAHSVLMDRVTVGPDAVVKSCVVGRGVVIGRKCHLTDCRIADGANVPDGTKLTDEAIEGSGDQACMNSMDDVEGEFMFEI